LDTGIDCTVILYWLALGIDMSEERQNERSFALSGKLVRLPKRAFGWRRDVQEAVFTPSAIHAWLGPFAFAWVKATLTTPTAIPIRHQLATPNLLTGVIGPCKFWHLIFWVRSR
jgi:hypothetical protein